MAGKMPIKPFKLPSRMDQNAATSLWKNLESSIDEIYQKKNSDLSFETLYRNGYNLVLQKHGDLLYRGVSSSFQGHTQQTLTEILAEPDENLLSTLLRSWEEHRRAISMIRDIVMYMDRTYVSQHKLLPIYDTGLTIFRTVIINNSLVKEKFLRILLANVEKERKGQLIDHLTMKGILSMLVELSINGEKVYENEFESIFLFQSRVFYSNESQECLHQQSYSCIEYLTKVNQRYQQEEARLRNYLSKTTELKLLNILDVELLSNHAEALVHMERSGCQVMLHENNIVHLKQLCQLFMTRVPLKVQLIRDCMSQYIKRVGYEILADQEKTKEKPVMFVENILALKDKFDHIIQICLQNDQKSLRVLKESFEEFMNKDNRTAAFLALFVDDLMKSGSKEMTESEAEEKLDKVIVIFRYINDKDVFEAYYKNFLSKRLLSGKGVNDDMERTMISKLKSECGYQFTSKLEGMFTDIRLSKSTLENYLTTTESAQSCPYEVDITILTAGFWPSSSESMHCRIPPMIMSHCTDPFAAYYFSTHTGRKLYWQFQLGSAEVKGNFQDGKRELTISTYQLFILLLFNDHLTLSLHEIRERTGIPELELRRHLLSLCTPKFKILNKLSKIKGIADNDQFTFNHLYSSKLKRIKIPLISQKECSGGSGGSDDVEKSLATLPPSVEEDRRHLIEAAIVRIMKARKTLSHNDLLAETMRQSAHRFAVDAQFVKKRVESLIEREYLVRDKTDRRVYHYQA